MRRLAKRAIEFVNSVGSGSKKEARSFFNVGYKIWLLLWEVCIELKQLAKREQKVKA